jgi:hypothetical protein
MKDLKFATEVYRRATNRFKQSSGHHLWLGDDDFDAVTGLLNQALDLGSVDAGQDLYFHYATRDHYHHLQESVCRRMIDACPTDCRGWDLYAWVRLCEPTCSWSGSTKDQREANRLFLMATTATTQHNPFTAYRVHRRN